jgi:hypothetical protein
MPFAGLGVDGIEVGSRPFREFMAASNADNKTMQSTDRNRHFSVAPGNHRRLICGWPFDMIQNGNLQGSFPRLQLDP